MAVDAQKKRAYHRNRVLKIKKDLRFMSRVVRIYEHQQETTIDCTRGILASGLDKPIEHTLGSLAQNKSEDEDIHTQYMIDRRDEPDLDPLNAAPLEFSVRPPIPAHEVKKALGNITVKKGPGIEEIKIIHTPHAPSVPQPQQSSLAA
jgi:hypothetical protein